MNQLTYIYNARIVDGTGSPAFAGSLLFDHNEILAVRPGPVMDLPADVRRIDAGGRTVTPGFIDIHRHPDAEPLKNSRFGETMLRQGITTTVVGNCGISLTPAPADALVRKSMADYYEPVLGPLDYDQLPLTFADYLDRLSRTALPVNMAAMIGTGAVRIAVKGFSDAPYTEEELDRAEALIDEALSLGAPGVSLGIMYLPECYSSKKEFARILQPVGRHNKVITTHIRGEGDSLVASIREVIEIAREAGCALEISHFKSCGMSNWGRSIHEAIGLIEEARSQGQDVTCDFYPYDGGSTALTTMLPPVFVGGDLTGALKRLGTQEGLQDLQRDISRTYADWDNYAISLGWDRILISGVTLEKYRPLLGMNMEEAAKQAGYADALSLAAEMMHEEEGKTAIINLSMSQADIDTIARLPYSLLISDSIYAATDTPHPRMHGAFPKFLREYVRERRLLSFEEAVGKMTQMPAERMKLARRGVLREGFVPDILLFDPARFTDHATYGDPARLASGLDYCFIGGEAVLKDDQVLSTGQGRLLKV